MCEFISWIEKDGQVYYLTYKDIYRTKRGKELREHCIRAADYIGHGAIRYFYDNFDGGTNHECTDFSTPKNFPPEIVRAIKKGEFRGLGIGRGLLLAAPLKAYNVAMAAPLKAYDAATVAASKAYNVAMAAPLKAYDAATVAASKAYDAATVAPLKAYNAPMAAASKAYDAATVAPLKAYNAAMVAANKAYDAPMAAASKAYDAATVAASKAYDAATGIFWDLFRVKKNRNPLWR